MIDWDALILAPAHAAFGEADPIAYYLAIGGPFQLQGVFNDRYKETTIENGQMIDDFKAILGVRSALFAVLPQKGDLFRVRSVLYAATNVEADGLGELKISLRAANNAEAAKARIAL